MDFKALLTVFATVFMAELGDKTQLATVLFAADAKHNPWLIFVASSAALVCAAGLGVLAGGWLSRHVDTRHAVHRRRHRLHRHRRLDRHRSGPQLTCTRRAGRARGGALLRLQKGLVSGPGVARPKTVT